MLACGHPAAADDTSVICCGNTGGLEAIAAGAATAARGGRSASLADQLTERMTITVREVIEVSYRERQRLTDIQAAIDAIRSHLQRGDLSRRADL